MLDWARDLGWVRVLDKGGLDLVFISEKGPFGLVTSIKDQFCKLSESLGVGFGILP